MIYQVGGSLKNDAPCYVERKGDRDLYEALKRGEFCYVLNCRQMGKSSLLVRTRHQLQREGYKCATLDLTMIGGENITPLQWYKGIVADWRRGFQLSREFNLKTWWKEADNLSFLQRLSYFISDILLPAMPADKIVIFIDEIDSILSLDFPVDDFFALIRFCYNQRATNPEYNRLTFAIFGVATPSDLIQDRNRTPFNIGTAIALSGFSLAEVEPLARGLNVESGNQQEIIQHILDWTNGQPFLTQKICQIIAHIGMDERGKKIEIAPETESFFVESIVRNSIIDEWQSQDEPEHLKTIRDRLLRNQKRAGRLLEIYQKILQNQSVKFDNSREQTELILSGIVAKKGEKLVVKNRIYEAVFNLEWAVEQLSAIRPYSQTFDAWVASSQTDESRLLRGRALKDAQIWAMGKSLGDLDYQFLAASVELDRKEVQKTLEAERTREIEIRLLQEEKTARLQRFMLAVVTVAFAISSGLGIFASWQYRRARISEILALASSSKGLFASHDRLEATVVAIKAKRRLDALGRADETIAEPVETALTQAVYGSGELNRLSGHQGSILSLDISPDGKLLATGGQDKTAKIWRSDGQLLHSLNHSATVFRVAFSPDGKTLVSGGLDGTVRLWGSDGKLLKKIPAHDASVWGVAFSPDGQMIASSSSDRTVKVWRTDGTLVATLEGHQQAVWNVAFDAESQIVASAGVDGDVKLWSIEGQLLKTLEGHQASVWDVAFCQKNNLLVSGSSDRTAKLWRTDGTLVRTFGAEDVILGVDCSENGEYIATGGNDNAVKIWRTDGTLVRTFKKHDGVVRDVALTADGLTAASASDDGMAKLWRYNPELSRQLYGHDNTVWSVAVRPDDELIFSGGDTSLRLWRSDGKPVHTIDISSAGVRSLAVATDSDKIAIGTTSFLVKVFDLKYPNKLPAEPVRVLAGHQGSIYAVAISPDGETIASGSDDRTVKLWSIDGEMLDSFVGHKERIWAVAFSPDGQMIASASEDATVKLWNLDGRAIATLPHQNPVPGLAFNPRGNGLVTASRDDTLTFWKLDGTRVKSIRAESGGLTRVAFSPDGQTIATGGGDKTVKLWDLEGNLLATLPGHESMVIAVDFTPDGKFLVSGGDDHAVIVWDLEKIETLNELEYACDWVRDYLRTNVEVEGSDRDLCKTVGN